MPRRNLPRKSYIEQLRISPNHITGGKSPAKDLNSGLIRLSPQRESPETALRSPMAKLTKLVNMRQSTEIRKGSCAIQQHSSSFDPDLSARKDLQE